MIHNKCTYTTCMLTRVHERAKEESVHDKWYAQTLRSVKQEVIHAFLIEAFRDEVSRVEEEQIHEVAGIDRGKDV